MTMDIPTRVQILRDTVRQALVFMMDKQPLDSNRVQWSNNHIMKQADALFTIQGNSPEEEAELCSVLLMSYQVLNEHNPDKDQKVQAVLNRSAAILDQLAPSLLKCELLTYCYGEIYDSQLAAEAHTIIDSWHNSPLSAAEKEIIETLELFEQHPYNHWQEAI